MKKKFSSVVLSICVLMNLLILLPIIATATTSGTCGENVTWTLDANGTLTISGTGDMKNYSNYNWVVAPWRDKDITSVVIKNGVTSIGDYAFYFCDKLTNITIPDSVTSIGRSSFCCCDNLTNIILPNNLTSVGVGAFYVCSSLTSITIPERVTSIGNGAFGLCDSLTSITVSENNTCYSSIDGILYNKNKTELIRYPMSNSKNKFTIPNTAEVIATEAFEYCRKLTSITISDNVTAIGESAFYGCENLITITIPDSVTSIGDIAFSGCSSLTSITIPKDVTSLGYGTFYVCRSLTSITIPDGVKTIGEEAFWGCEKLTSITIPDSVKSIGEGAFYGCDALTYVYYLGKQADWENISVGDYNEPLLNATVRYISPPLPTTTAKITKTETKSEYKFKVDAEKKYDDCYVYAATYDENGILLGINKIKLDTKDNTTISVNKNDNTQTAKVFILAEMLQPIISAEKFELK